MKKKLLLSFLAASALGFVGAAHAKVDDNGLSSNVLSFNALSSNVLSFNVLSFNALSSNVLSFNVLSFNALSSNVLSFNRLAFNRLALNGVVEAEVAEQPLAALAARGLAKKNP